MALDFGEEVGQRLGFAHESIGAAIPHLLEQILIGLQSGKNNHGQLGMVSLKKLEQIEAVFAGETDIDDGQVERSLTDQVSSLVAGNRRGYLEAFFTKIE